MLCAAAVAVVSSASEEKTCHNDATCDDSFEMEAVHASAMLQINAQPAEGTSAKKEVKEHGVKKNFKEFQGRLHELGVIKNVNEHLEGSHTCVPEGVSFSDQGSCLPEGVNEFHAALLAIDQAPATC